MPNFNFLACFISGDILANAPTIETSHIHFSKSPKRDPIYKLYLWMPEEHNCLILTS